MSFLPLRPWCCSPLYTVIDGILVAHGVSESALTSVNISLPFINVLSGLSILLSMGASTLCAFALGRGKKREAEEIFTQTVVVMVILSSCHHRRGSPLHGRAGPSSWGAGPQTLENAVTYLRIVSVFSVCFILSYCLEVMVKVDDSPVLATVGVAVAAVVHVGLAYVFIFHFHWGWQAAPWPRAGPAVQPDRLSDLLCGGASPTFGSASSASSRKPCFALPAPGGGGLLH